MSEWINVKDRMPTNSNTLLISDNEDTYLGYWSENYKSFFCIPRTNSGDDMFYDVEVVYWLEVPPLPVSTGR